MPRSNRVSIVAAFLVVVALATVGLLRRDPGEPVTDAQVSSTVGAYYRADLEALYLHEVRSSDGAALAATGDAGLLARGHGICSALDAGSPLPGGGAAFEVDIAVTVLCPQHAGVVSS